MRLADKPPSLVRLLLIAGALLYVAAAVAVYASGRRTAGELGEMLAAAGFGAEEDGPVDRVRHERAPHQARVEAARALVYAVLDAEDREGPLGRLPLAAGEARRALAAQPTSYQAAMFLGVTTYLERSVHRDRRLFTEAVAWEDPLWAAVGMAPGQAEPRRFLAGAYLEVWRALSAEKRQRARQLLAEALAQDPRAFDALTPTWLEVAADLDEALAVYPDRSAVWRRVARVFAEERRWPAYCHVRRLLDAALLREGRAKVAEAEDRLALGDLRGGRVLLLEVVAGTPQEAAFAPLVTRALELYPPGLHGSALAEPLAGWLRFTLALQAVGRSPLPPHVVGRLAGIAGNVDPELLAHAAVAAGEIRHAERLEGQAQTLAAEPWGPYLVAKAERLVESHRGDEAARTLAQTDAATRRTLAYARVRAEVARASGDLAGAAAADQALAAFRRREWSAAEWRFRGPRTSLAMLPAAAATGLAVAVNKVPRTGVVVELTWDGHLVAREPVLTDGVVELEVEVTPEPHLLELVVVAGGRPLPGRVGLLGELTPGSTR